MSENTGAASGGSASRHLDVVIEHPWRRVYEHASDPRNLPRSPCAA